MSIIILISNMSVEHFYLWDYLYDLYRYISCKMPLTSSSGFNSIQVGKWMQVSPIQTLNWPVDALGIEPQYLHISAGQLMWINLTLHIGIFAIRLLDQKTKLKRWDCKFLMSPVQNNQIQPVPVHFFLQNFLWARGSLLCSKKQLEAQSVFS